MLCVPQNNDFKLLSRLKQIHEFSQLPDADLIDLLTNSTPKSTIAKQKVFGLLLSKIGIDLTELTNARKLQRKAEILNNATEAQKAVNQKAYFRQFEQHCGSIIAKRAEYKQDLKLLTKRLILISHWRG